MKKPNQARAFVALAALALCLAATPAMAASHAKHPCVKGAHCTYARTGKHNKLCERGTHTASHAAEGKHDDAKGHNGHDGHR